MHGNGEIGQGEGVTYDNEGHYTLQDSSEDFPVTGEYTIDEFSEQLSEVDPFLRKEPSQSIFRNYRRWAFESAALDLVLKQVKTDLADRLSREYSPVRFVVSTCLKNPPTGDRILDWLDRNPDLEFKLDPTSDWTTDVVKRLAETDAIRALDPEG